MHGFLTALHAAGVPHDPRLAPDTVAFTRADGASAMRVLLGLDEPPDAVFCFSDLLASGAVRAAHEHGLRVPRDLAVVGFDDIQETGYSVPSLTTVSPNKREIAELAVDAVLQRITADAEAPHTRLTAGYSLVVRESTQPDSPPG